ncbi:MAG TPA: TdeIII family type II restriction endonuclease, partial [Candidatus Paceibacterota bacterium]|nr:TdeIII family type II restriction endonuclease [Candidatus Paceibacterota bacterium]
MALFSFIHSLNTTFGISIFEPVAETLASLNFEF